MNNPGQILVLKQNQTGGFDSFATFNLSSSFILYYSDVDTNGIWVATSYFDNSGRDLSALIIFKVEDDGSISNVQQPNITGITIEFIRFLSDGSLVGFNSYTTATKPAKIFHFALVNSQWTLIGNFTFNENLRFGAASDLSQWKSLFHLTDTTLIAFNFVTSTTGMINVYERSSDWTWTLSTSFNCSLYLYHMHSLAWNGNDTIFSSVSHFLDSYINASNGAWNLLTRTNDSYVGLTSGVFGYDILPIGQDTVLVSAPGFDQKSNKTGRVAVLQRRQGTWSVVGLISGSINQYYVGTTMRLTDRSVFFDGDKVVHSVPRCLFEPLNYTCSQYALVDSCNMNDFDANQVCTTTQSDCAAMITTVVHNYSNVSSDTVQVDFEIQRFAAESVLQSVTISCSSSNPSTNPNQPQAANAPSSTATPPNNNGLTSAGEIYRPSTLLSLCLAILVSAKLAK